MNKQEVSAKLPYTDEFEEDILSGLEIPTGVTNLHLRSARDIDVITPLSEDFIATPVSPQPVQDSDPVNITVFFASRDEHSFIVILENEVHRNVIDEIRIDGWDIKFSVSDKLSDISEIIGFKQFSERFGLRISDEEPSIHELKKHQDEDDDNDDQTGNNGEDINIVYQLLTSSTIDNSQSSDQTQKTSSSQSDITTSQAVLAIGIAIGSIAYYAGGYALPNLDSNPIIDSFKNSFLEQLDYYL